jgi:hypothetical protein
MINRFQLATQITFATPIPSPLKKTLSNLKFVIKNLPQKELSLQGDFTSPN